jgi:hypothetical protein
MKAMQFKQRKGSPLIAVVVEGTIRTQAKGEPEAIYKAGQGFL